MTAPYSSRAIYKKRLLLSALAALVVMAAVAQTEVLQSRVFSAPESAHARPFSSVADAAHLSGAVHFAIDEQGASLVFESTKGVRYERRCLQDTSAECTTIWLQATFALQVESPSVEDVTLSTRKLADNLRLVELRRGRDPFLVLVQANRA